MPGWRRPNTQTYVYCFDGANNGMITARSSNSFAYSIKRSRIVIAFQFDPRTATGSELFSFLPCLDNRDCTIYDGDGRQKGHLKI